MHLLFSSFSWLSETYFLPYKTDRVYSKVNTKSHCWSSTAWTWIEMVCSLIQSFWMHGISCEQRNKQTKKVVENRRFSRISEMIYFRAGFRMANRCKGFLWPLFSELVVSLPTRDLDSCLFSPFLWTSKDSLSEYDMSGKICLIRKKCAWRMMPYYHILFTVWTFHCPRQEDRVLNLA